MKVEKPKSGTTIRACGCQHKFQDERYGRGNRVHNISAKGSAVCTVCLDRKP